MVELSGKSGKSRGSRDSGEGFSIRDIVIDLDEWMGEPVIIPPPETYFDRGFESKLKRINQFRTAFHGSHGINMEAVKMFLEGDKAGDW